MYKSDSDFEKYSHLKTGNCMVSQKNRPAGTGMILKEIRTPEF